MRESDLMGLRWFLSVSISPAKRRLSSLSTTRNDLGEFLLIPVFPCGLAGGAALFPVVHVDGRVLRTDEELTNLLDGISTFRANGNFHSGAFRTNQSLLTIADRRLPIFSRQIFTTGCELPRWADPPSPLPAADTFRSLSESMIDTNDGASDQLSRHRSGQLDTDRVRITCQISRRANTAFSEQTTLPLRACPMQSAPCNPPHAE